jgi:hypothetical protein
MLFLLAALVAMAAGMWAPAGAPAAAPSSQGVALRYDPPLGQIARYRVSLDVTGTQTSLGERLPVRWKAEGELREEVVAKGGDGSFWLRVHMGPLVVTEADGTFANGMGAEWPETRLHVSPTGEVLETAQVGSEKEEGARERALGALMVQVVPVILASRPIEPGREWKVESGGAKQTNRLLSLEGTGDSQTAHIASTSRSPLALDEGVAELGLVTRLSGEAQQTSELELAVRTGLVRRHKGRTHLVTRSQVSLSLPEGSETFLMESDLTIAFDIRLQTVDGKGISAR